MGGQILDVAMEELDVAWSHALLELTIALNWSYAVLWTRDASRKLVWKDGYFNIQNNDELCKLFHTVYKSCVFPSGVGFAGHALESKSNSILWMTGDELEHGLPHPLPEQSSFLRTAAIQTVVSVPLGPHVLELGTVNTVQESEAQANNIKGALLPPLTKRFHSIAQVDAGASSSDIATQSSNRIGEQANLPMLGRKRMFPLGDPPVTPQPRYPSRAHATSSFFSIQKTPIDPSKSSRLAAVETAGNGEEIRNVAPLSLSQFTVAAVADHNLPQRQRQQKKMKLQERLLRRQQFQRILREEQQQVLLPKHNQLSAEVQLLRRGSSSRSPVRGQVEEGISPRIVESFADYCVSEMDIGPLGSVEDSGVSPEIRESPPWQEHAIINPISIHPRLSHTTAQKHLLRLQRGNEARASQMLKRRSRNKQHDTFSQLKAMIPTPSKAEKSSLLTATMAYINKLQKRVADLGHSNQSLKLEMLESGMRQSDPSSPGPPEVLTSESDGDA